MSLLKDIRIACLGSGIMGGLLVKRLVNANAVPATNIICSDSLDEKLASLEAIGVQTTLGNIEAAAKSDIIIVAVPPPAVMPVLSEIASIIQPGSLIISVAAGLTVAKMRSVVPAGVHLARIMPNTPSEVGKGMNTFVCEPGMPQQQREIFSSLLDVWGKSLEIDESVLNAACALLAVGPTYLFPLAGTLMASAQTAGLSEIDARQATAQLFKGVGAMLSETNHSADDLLNMINFQPMDADTARKVISDAYNAAFAKQQDVQSKLSGE